MPMEYVKDVNSYPTNIRGRNLKTGFLEQRRVIESVGFVYWDGDETSQPGRKRTIRFCNQDEWRQFERLLVISGHKKVKERSKQ